MDVIKLKGMRFLAKHGVLAEEKTNEQVFLIDVSMYLNLEESGKNDKLECTVNYAEVYEIVKNRVLSNSYDLIEKLCYTIINDILNYADLIDRVRVSVHKPNAPINGEFGDVSVTMERGRDVSVLP